MSSITTFIPRSVRIVTPKEKKQESCNFRQTISSAAVSVLRKPLPEPPRQPPIKLSTVDINKQITSHFNNDTPENAANFILEIMQQQLPNLNEVNISTAIFKLGKLAQEEPDLKNDICEKLAIVAPDICKKFQTFLPLSIANSWRGLGYLEFHNKEIFDALIEVSSKRLVHLDTHELSSIPIALGRITVQTTESKKLLESCKVVFLQKMSKFSLDNISLIVQAYGRLKIVDDALLSNALDELCSYMHNLDLIQITRVTWTVSTLHYNDPLIIKKIGYYLLDNHNRLKFEPETIVTLLNSFETYLYNETKSVSSDVIELLLSKAEILLEKFNPYELSSITRVIARSENQDDQLVRKIADRSWHIRNEFTTRQAAELINFFGKIGFFNNDLFVECSEKYKKTISTIKITDALSFLYGYASVGFFPSNGFVTTLVEKIMRLSPTIDQLALTAFSLLLLKQHNSATQITEKILRENNDINSCDLATKNILWTLCSYFNMPTPIPEASIKPTTSIRQLELMHFLRNEFPEQSFVSEHSLGPYYLDIAIVEKKIAIEYNGSSHYIFSSTERRKTIQPRFICKQELLTKLGWQVIVIPYFEWYEKEDWQKKQYLQKILPMLGSSPLS